MSAREIRAYRNVSTKLTKIEERGRLIGILMARGVGFKEEEEFIEHEETKFHSNKNKMKRKREIVKMLMMEKKRDNAKHENRTRKLRNKMLGSIEGILGRKSRPCRELRKSVRIDNQNLRLKLRAKNDKKVAFLTKKYGMRYKYLEELVEEDRSMYEGARIFDNNQKLVNEDQYKPEVVCVENEVISIDEYEADVLSLGPKFCVRGRLDEELFEGEMEECIMKYRWDQMGRDKAEKEAKEEDKAYRIAITQIFTAEENKIMEEEIEEQRLIDYAKSRMIYDPLEAKINLSKRRATDQKSNARVIFPRRSSFDTEAKIETLRTEVMAEFRKFRDEKCGKGGKLPSNLTKNQQKGLKSLLKRVKDGEIVIVPTDKTGRFTVMSRRAYEEAGMVHVKGDTKVDWGDLKEAQTRLNGHVAMMIKTFRIGKAWEHDDRIRETMMNKGMTVCPLSLLFKDHKGWSRTSGKPPPTRQVAGGHMGMNLHLSEIISDILEPIVENIPGGEEVISSEDLQANFEELNEVNNGWHRYIWWSEVEDEVYRACKNCPGDEQYIYDVMNPELCRCEMKNEELDKVAQPQYMRDEQREDVIIVEKMKNMELEELEKVVQPSNSEDVLIVEKMKNMELEELEIVVQPSSCEDVVIVENMKDMELEELEKVVQPHEVEVVAKMRSAKIRTTCRFLKLHRRAIVEDRISRRLQEEEDIVVRSREVNPEDIQDFDEPMVIIGSDVISLYPNLDVTKVSKEMREAIKVAKIEWEEVDYREAARYVALNWSREQCERSPLSRILPRRRGRTGVRPGIKGKGPRGKECGDQEQWIFAENLIITAEEREELIATVVSIATQELFRHHYYSFGGAVYHQEGGGPIGLRATCAVARVVMQMYDQKWKKRLDRLLIRIWMMKRYMDDGRVCLPSIKPGWRIIGDGEEEELVFSPVWEREDQDQQLTREELTKRILLKTMNGIEDYLNFTAEVGGEYEGGWLPTLDMEVRVNDQNAIVYRQYEKPISSKRTVQKTSAMGENTKQQILSQDMIRRLRNTSESLGAGAKIAAVDQYTQKLINSGYSREQVARIIVNGIKGYEGMRRRRIKEGRKLRSTAAQSSVKRYRSKLLGKTTWFKKRKEGSSDKRMVKDQKSGSRKYKEQTVGEEIEYRTVLFVDNTEGGELTQRMKDLSRRLARSIGFGVKIVERNGSSLKSIFPLNNLWDGAPCGRSECKPCNQGAEEPPKCNKASMVYENICRRCNRGAEAKKELPEVVEGSIYVGESSRTLFERSKEHQKDWESRKTESHIAKHQGAAHGLGEEPDFIIKPVRFYKTALSRQIGEAVRIRRRGGAGAILNSKSEFSRCKIPRLVLEDVDDEEEQIQEQLDREEYTRNVEEQAEIWGAQALQERKDEDRRRWKGAGKQKVSKRMEEAPVEQRKRKKLKYSPVEESWGMEEHNKVEGSSLNVTSNADTPCSTITKDSNSDIEKRKQSSIRDFVSTDVRLRSEKDRSSLDTGVKENKGEDILDTLKNSIVDKSSSMSTQVSEKLTPSVEEDIPCKPDKRGRCVKHGTEMKTQKISNKKWGDRGGGRGFGWKYGKTTKYICVKDLEVKRGRGISTVFPSATSEAGLGKKFGDVITEGGLVLQDTTTTGCCDVKGLTGD